ncbi:hypothetical protein [Ensifer aridi]|uniref:hypothetical protein n=1 Tax=Ensifer aridi TaxID=1708715 RepID=UPI000A122245|nr:hypothetical protein [Ensifer aridi]
MIAASSIHEVAIRLSRAEDHAAAFIALEAVTSERFGHILFTALRFDYDDGVMTRLYSNRIDVTPVGGTKPIPTGPWADRIISQRSCYVGRRKEDLKEVFFDYEPLWAIGCESVMNVPVVWANRTIGSINILGGPSQYDEITASEMMIFAQMSTPLFCCPP